MRKFFIAAALAVVAMIGASAEADAAFAIRFSTTGGSPGSFTTVNDGDIADDDTGVDGSISFRINGLTIRAIASYSSTGDLTTFDLHLANSQIPSGSSFNLVVQASFDSAVTAPPPQTLHTVYGTSILPVGQLTTSAQTWVTNGSTLFQTSPNVADTGVLALNDTATTSFTTTTTPYTVTTQITLTGTTTSSSTSISLDVNNQITPAPAPAGLLLGLAGLPVFGLGAYIRRRRAVKA